LDGALKSSWNDPINANMGIYESASDYFGEYVSPFPSPSTEEAALGESHSPWYSIAAGFLARNPKMVMRNADVVEDVTKGVKDLKSTLLQENPRNLIPTQTKAEMSGSQVKRLTKDMKQNGYDQSKPVDAWRNPETGRLEIQDGHHRAEAAKKAGLDKIPVKVWE